MAKDINRRFGPSIRKNRVAMGVAPSELAKKCGISTGFLRSIENGSYGPSYDTAQSLVYALGLELKEHHFERMLKQDLWDKYCCEESVVNSVINKRNRQGNAD